MPKLLVTGASGMLAYDLLPFLKKTDFEVIETDFNELDITSLEQVKNVLSQTKPQWVVNCAAYTAVDKAEEERDKAFAVNADGAGNLARVSAEQGISLLHVSTDYVFDGESSKPYGEDDIINPCGVYGESKAEGERQVQEFLGEEALIVRTSWLHGVGGPNFVDTMLKLGRERDKPALSERSESKGRNPLKIVSDQIGSPTWTSWLSNVLVKLIERDGKGIFHASSRGGISWYDFAKEIFLKANLEVQVLEQTTEELGRPAPRPRYSVFDLAKLEEFIGEDAISWQDCVKGHLEALCERDKC